MGTGSTVVVIDSVEGLEAECIWLHAYKIVSTKFLLDLLEPVPSCDLFGVFPRSFE